jgi:hypothetical protein
MSTFPRVLVRACIAVGAVGAVAAASLLTACGSAAPSQPAALPAPAAPATGPSSAPTAPATSAAPEPPAASGPAGAGLAACRTAALRITVDDGQAGGGAGSAYYPLNFTNISGQPCEMYGYPGVSFAATPDDAGRQIGAAAQRSATFAKVAVRLGPGAAAHAWLKVTVAANYPPSACEPVTAHWLRVYPPAETVPGYVSHDFSACASMSTALLTVLPVRSGQALAGVTP